MVGWNTLRATWAAALMLAIAGCGDDPAHAGDPDADPTGSADTGRTDSGATIPGTSSSSADADAGASTSGADPSGDDEPIFDVAAIPDIPASACDEGGVMVDGTHSYIWIANSSEGTVSKINTESLIEEGRYIVRPDSAGNPSRTSVGLSGDVVVANRSGGVVKIYSDLSKCVESNGAAGIQTSTGAGDVLAWGEDECIAWYTPFDYTTQRPVAWTRGEWNEDNCSYEDEKIWTAGDLGTAEVVLLDGDTGVVEEMTTVPEVFGWAGLYGGAVDADGNFWTVDHNWQGPSHLIRVDRSDLEVHRWLAGNVHYGLAVDAVGRAWLCGGGGASRFDPETEEWTHLNPASGGSHIGGCMTDGEGTLWHSEPGGVLVGIDTESVSIVQSISLPSYVHGVSIDFAGNVWGVEFALDEAFRVDPETGTVDTVGGLNGAYTYSDMTGFALTAVGSPTPSG